ncbi:winged helix-turn-helix transcriptional regulator [Spirosoma pollinicola]|uniref:winged helix-turn-helix transcriptional regulator n=1 Tax=Spirosoma pollinicola TaxID=2057025 RepID=UPI001981E088|nr:helix-turn-helix domain-containing protein [Spirosoma pollinicola]
MKRPSELHKSIPQASARVLNQQLSELESHGIIEKKNYNVLPPKVEYSLTTGGERILDVLYAMKNWGEGYKKTFYELLKQKKP